jgi:hypothetical protein
MNMGLRFKVRKFNENEKSVADKILSGLKSQLSEAKSSGASKDKIDRLEHRISQVKKKSSQYNPDEDNQRSRNRTDGYRRWEDFKARDKDYKRSIRKNEYIGSKAQLGLVSGMALGSIAGGLTTRKLKAKLREKYPNWNNSKIDKEYNRILGRRVRVGGTVGALGGFYLGGSYGKYKTNKPDFK